MIKKISKILVIFLVMLGISFSNVPFYVLSTAINSYISGRNIVDKAWHLSKDENVVDKFTSYRNLAERIKIQEAQAASTTNGTTWFLSNTNASTAFGTTGPVAEYATANDITPAVPTLKTTAKAMTDTPGTAQVTVGGAIGSGVTWFRTFLSPRLAAQTINSGMTFRVQIAGYESSTSANAYRRVHVYVWREGTGFVATLIDGTGANCVTATEFTTAERGFSCITSATAANRTLLDGDQIAVEVWIQAVTGYTENIYYGGPTFITHNVANANAMSSFGTSRVVTLQTATTNGTTWFLTNTNSATAFGTTGPVAEYATANDITPAVPTLKTTALAMTDTPGTAQTTIGGLIGSGVTWFRTFLSPQLAAQTINSGMTFRVELAGKETSTSANAFTRVHVYVWREGTGFVVTLIDGTGANCVTALEYGTAESGRSCITSATAANRTLLDGDQIAVEVWVQAVTGYTENLYYGGPTFISHSVANTNAMSSFGTSRVVTLQSAVAATLTIGVTAGSKATVLNSGDTSQYANTTGCSAPASCAAFTLAISSGSETITSIKITETGTADATNNLANLALFYDTDGNYSNGTTGQYGSTVAAFTSEAANVTGSLAISTGTTYYFYVRFDLVKSSTYPKGGQTVKLPPTQMSALPEVQQKPELRQL